MIQLRKSLSRIAFLIAVFLAVLYVWMAIYRPFNISPVYHCLQKSNCCSIAEENKLEDLCPMNVVPPSIEGVNSSCTDYMLCKLVMLIALSSSHFRESEKYTAMANAKLPNTKVIVYDLGLKKNEIRKFKFDQYPGHVKDLHNYAWKPFSCDHKVAMCWHILTNTFTTITHDEA